MFNVSALLLDDTSKTATLLTKLARLTKRGGSLPHSVMIACFRWLIVVNHQRW